MKQPSEPAIARHRRAVVTYSLVIALAALGAGLTDSVFSNYFKDAYNTSALQRGLIEFPRELPGFLVIFVVAILSTLSTSRISLIAHGLAIVGLVVLGLTTPTFLVMLIFLFINSMGGHLWYPMQDSLGMQLIRDEKNAGRTVGRFKSVSTAFSMIAAGIVFVGFRTGIFSFVTPVKWSFLIAAAFFFVAILLLVKLDRLIGLCRRPAESASQDDAAKPARKVHLVFRRQYKFYYILATVYGVQKQIMLVYAPWVLIDLLDKKTDTLAILGIIGSLIGIFFIPALGRWLDRFGIKKMLYADAISFILVYAAYGLLSAGFASGWLMRSGLPVLLVFALFILDRMSMQMGIIRSLYLRSIALEPADIAPTLTTGQCLDHIVSIICGTLGGIIWVAWGPQYIFFLAAILSTLNYFVAWKADIPHIKPEPELAIAED